MRDYMTTLGVIMMMIAFSNILMPQGSIKKFASLATGFMVICAAVSPLEAMPQNVKFSAESFETDSALVESAQAKYRASVIKEHRENLAEKISERIKHGSSVSVEVSEEGEIISVSINLKGDESNAVRYIVEELKVPRERIKLNYENN